MFSLEKGTDEIYTWVKVQNLQNPELQKSNLKTCNLPTITNNFQV